MTRILDSFDQIAGRYRAAFVDLWGCLHNGYTPFAPAVAALERFKARGGIVVLLTNSPRSKPAVIRQLDKIGVPRGVYDEVAASGDASQYALAAGDVGSRVYHLGPERDLGFFEGLPEDVLKGRRIERVALEEAGLAEDGARLAAMGGDDGVGTGPIAVVSGEAGQPGERDGGEGIGAGDRVIEYGQRARDQRFGVVGRHSVGAGVGVPVVGFEGIGETDSAIDVVLLERRLM